MNKKTVFVALAIEIVAIGILTAIAMVYGGGTSTTVLISAFFVLVVGGIGFGSLYKGYSKEYDERMVKARSDAAFLAFMVTLILIMSVGFMSFTSDGRFPLSLYSSSMVCSMVGIATFIILSDMQDAYLSMTQKRFGCSIAFFFLGIIQIFSSGFWSDHNPDPDRIATLLGMGICWLVIGCEMFIKSAIDRKAASVEDMNEESEA